MKSGQRLRSQACGGEVIVIRAAGASHSLEVGGKPMTDDPSAASETTVTPHDGFLLGKRYELTDGETRIEVMVTRAGSHPITYQGQNLTSSATKALPSSD
jgi:hypothetical protein